jgi:hypothetical protein
VAQTGAAPAVAAPAVAASSLPAPKARSRAWLAAIPIAAAAIAATVVILVRRHDKPAVASPPVAPEPAAVVPANVAPPMTTPPPPLPEPAEVHITIHSKPDGADVYRMPSETKVGTTPWDEDLASADGMAVFVVKKRGYGDARVQIDLRTGGAQDVELASLATVKPPPTKRVAPGKEPVPNVPSGRKKGEPVDPFAPPKGSTN